MEKALFIVRSPYGKAIYAMEIYLSKNIFGLAHEVMDAVEKALPDECAHCCEVWERTDPNSMNLVVTVF